MSQNAARDSWENARLIGQQSEQVTLRLEGSVLDALRAEGGNCATRISAILELYISSARKGNPKATRPQPRPT